jgi:dTDP-glucose pyrophosphorylase
MTFDAEQYFIEPASSIHDAIVCINRNTKGIALVVDQERYLLGTVTDGDIRRAILMGMSQDTPVSELLSRRDISPKPSPVTAQVGTPLAELLQVMQEHSVRQLPILDAQGRVVDLVTQSDLLPESLPSLPAVIMAGGFGKRLRPLTEDLPKPMLPVGGRPLMERIIAQLRLAGVQKVNVTTHYKPEKIREYFGNGQAFGVELSYVNEAHPLGTGGALGLLPAPSGPFLVINGDILTQVDFRAMLAFHQEHQADITVAVRQYSLKIPYGVVECEGASVCRLREKPEVSFLVNAGIYLLEPSVYVYMPNGQPFNMTDLIQWLLDDGRRVVSFPVHEYWLDIGQHTDYLQGQEDMKVGKLDA